MAGLFPNTVTTGLPVQQPLAFNYAVQPPVQNYTVPTTRSSNLIRVNSFDSAKAYPTSPNSDTILFDENEDVMYLKTTDASNFPVIRKFRFYEEVEAETVKQDSSKYVTVEEFNKFKEELLNGKQFIRKREYQYAKPSAGDTRPNKKSYRISEGEPKSDGYAGDVVETES